MPLFSTREWIPYGNVDTEELDKLINKILIGFSLLLLIPLASSMLRIETTGWLPLYGVHIALYMLVLGAALLRKRLNARAKAGVLIFCSFVVAAAGHYSFGLMAGGVFYLPIALVLMVFFFELRTVLLFCIFSLLGLGYVAWGFISGELQTAADPTEMHHATAQWLNYGFSMAVFFLMTSLIMRSYRAILRNVMDRIASQRDEIIQLTNYDRLTGVATLPLATEYIDEICQQPDVIEHQAGLLLINVEKIAEVNDAYGFDAGELALRTIGERLALLLRPDDKLARIGGSKYLVIIGKMKDDNRALFLAEMIVESLRKPIRTTTQNLELDCTIGITLFPDAGKDARQLILKANRARLQAEADDTSQFVLN